MYASLVRIAFNTVQQMETEMAVSLLNIIFTCHWCCIGTDDNLRGALNFPLLVIGFSVWCTDVVSCIQSISMVVRASQILRCQDML
jgi:hypothetical protein